MMSSISKFSMRIDIGIVLKEVMLACGASFFFHIYKIVALLWKAIAKTMENGEG